VSYANVLLTAAVLGVAVVAGLLLWERKRKLPGDGDELTLREEPPGHQDDVHSRFDGRDGVTILQGRPRLTEAYEELRTREHLNRVLAVWSADYGEIEKYFEEEAEWLRENPDVTVERVVVAQPHQRALLSELAGQHENLRLFTSTTKDTEFELYICEYTHPERLETRAGILVVNNMASRRPEFGVMIDAQQAPQLGPFVMTLSTWFDKLPRQAVQGRKGDEDVWTQNSALYDEHVDRNSPLPFLRDFIRSEDNYVAEVVGSAPGDVTFVEFGSGTGRTIHYLRSLPEVASKTLYFIGFDHSVGMIRESQTKRDNNPDDSASVTFFFTLDGATAFQNFWNGHLSLTEGLNDQVHLREHGFDPVRYQQSDKVFCCLLNTLGVLDQATRRQFTENLFLAATEADTVVISVFDRGAFDEHAEPLYVEINPLVGAPIDEYLLNSADAEFRAGSYFSHWFGEEELRKLIEDGGGEVSAIHPITMSDGSRIGHLAVCTKAPLRA
jgi:hypothetical protein